MARSNDIAVVGMACRFPHARDLNALWKVVRTGEVTFEDIPDTRWKHSAFFSADVRAIDKTYVRKGAFVDEVDQFAALHYGLAPRRVQVMDPQHRLLIETVRQAIQDAGYDQKTFDKRNTGVFVGASVSEYKDLLSSRLRAQSMVDGTYGDALSGPDAEAAKAAVADVVPLRAFSIAGNLLNMMAASVSQTFDLSGPSFTLDAACSSALVAIHEAVVHLRSGHCNLAVAGGVYLNFAPDNLVGFARIGAISPSGVCRPFDARADGFVMGEGVGVVMLKRLDDAKRDGDRIYAIIKGSGCNNDGRGEGPMTPRAEGQIDAMVRAHDDAGVPIETIGFVETHGTATTVGDVVEVGALKTFFESRAETKAAAPHAYLSSIKANIGHTMSAAGVAGFIKTALVLHHRTIVPQPSVEEINPKLELERSPFRISTTEHPWEKPATHPRRAAVSSFGFGGTNAHVVLEEAELAVEAGEREQLFVVSAPNESLLKSHLHQLANDVEQLKLDPGAVAHTLASRQRFDTRVAFVAKGREQLVEKLRAATPKKVDAASRKRIGFLYPGQGAQKVGVMRDLTERFGSFRARIESLGGKDIFSALYPKSPFSADAAQAHLTRTEICQPAMAALSVALTELLGEFALKPDVVVGHSLGEFVAAQAAGMLRPEDAVKLVARRGQLMNELKLDDNGAMLAVMAPRADVEAGIAGLSGVVVANHNHPTQTVLSGETAAVEQARAQLEAKGLKVTALDVSHAFHSPLMQGVDAGIAALLAELTVSAASREQVSCITGTPYASVDEAKDVWVKHATAPVEFVAALERAEADLWLQLGPGNALLSFARAHGGRAFLQTDSVTALLETLGTLFVEGLDVDVRALTPIAERTLVSLAPTPLETQTYWGVERTNRPARVTAPRVATTASTVPGVAMNDLVSLFQQQMALLQGQQDILKAQAAAIAALAGGQPMPALTAAAPAVPAPAPVAVAAAPAVIKPPNFSNLVASKQPAEAAPAPVAAAPVVSVRPDVESKVLASVARISAFPQDTLKLEQSLTGELGFDSLMLVELDGDVAKAWPKLGGLPRELFNQKTTIVDVVNHIVSALESKQSGAAPATATTAAESKQADAPAQLYTPTVTASPLHPLRESVFAFDAPLLVTKDAKGLAEQVVAELKQRHVDAVVGAADATGSFAGVIHLADLELTGDAKAGSLNQLKLAQRFTDAPDVFATVVTAPATSKDLTRAGALGFTKALAAEWPNTIVKAIAVDALAPTLAKQVVDEILSGDRTAEVSLGSARTVLTLQPAKKRELDALGSKDVVLITGGAKGLGLVFARSLASLGGTVVLAGRSAPTEEVLKLCAEVKAAGAKACSYQMLDARDADSVRHAVKSVKQTHGSLDVIVHSAGVLADALVAKKTVQQVVDVIDTKVSAVPALLEAKPKLLVMVGSWAGRFGNAAQTDYSAANAMLGTLAQQANGDTRVVCLDFPPFEDSAMAKKIPAFVKAEMKARGVTFLRDDEGAKALLDAVRSHGGEVLVGRNMPARVSEVHHASFPVSRLNHVYLNDHEMAGQRVLPLASAMDHVAAAALDAQGALGFQPFTLSKFSLKRPVLVPDTTWLDVKVDGEKVTLSQGNAVSYEGVMGAAKKLDGFSLSAIESSGALPMPLSEFYGGFTFHGPRLQGIVTIEAMSDAGITGVVRGNEPADWVKEPLRREWAIDPLLIDSSFQLAGYWAWNRLKRAGFPLGFESFTQLRPFGKGPLRCVVHFGAGEGDIFTGTLAWYDETDSLLAVMEGAKAEFKERNPQFATAAASSSTSTDAAVAKATSADPATYDFAKFPEYEELQERLQLAEAFGLKNPYFSLHERIAGDTTQVAGKEMINFSSYNYVGNSGDPLVQQAAKAAIDKYGTTVSASRVASGERPLHRELESELARFFGTESCLVFTAGHSTNVTVIGHIVGPQDLILHDALAHDSIIQGAKLSGAKRRPFPHDDWQALDKALTQLRPHYRRVLVCIEGAYSMDGDIANLPRFIEVKKKHGALLLVDEAHSAGVVGKTGRGVGEYFDVNRADVDLWMGTMSKSFASCGGYICGTKELIEYLKYTTPGFVYSVGLSPPNTAAALQSLRNIEAHPERPQRAVAQAKKFISLLKARDIDVGMSKDSPVVPAIIGNSVLCLQLSDRLKDRGINVQPILYPAVEESAARLRFFMCSTHTDEQLQKAADILSEELNRLRQEQAA